MARTSRRRRSRSGTGPLVAAWLATAAWLALSAFAFLGASGGEGDPLRLLTVPLVVLGPVAAIWVAFVQMRRSARLVRMVARLVDDGPTALPDPPEPVDLSVLEKKLDTALGLLRKAPPATAPAGPPPAAPRGPRPAAKPPAQPALGLPGEEDERPPLSVADLVAALHFPQDAGDEAGFRALRRALADHQGKVVVTAAQDLLTLLSQDGLYMDDLKIERARPDLWRRFAKGERGAQVGAVGGVRDEEALALVTQRLRADGIFRDVALHLLRVFDQLLARIEPRLTDGEIAQLSETRTSRAFMLVGRAMGTFD